MGVNLAANPSWRQGCLCRRSRRNFELLYSVVHVRPLRAIVRDGGSRLAARELRSCSHAGEHGKRPDRVVRCARMTSVGNERRVLYHLVLTSSSAKKTIFVRVFIQSDTQHTTRSLAPSSAVARKPHLPSSRDRIPCSRARGGW